VSAPLHWIFPETAIGSEGLAETMSASAEERTLIARELDILSCEALTARFEIKPGPGRSFFSVSGVAEADVTQACVVTLDPVAAHVSEEFAAEYRPMGTPEAKPVDVGDEAREVESLEHGLIDVGRLVFEHIAMALDPYPRKPGAEFAWKDPKAADAEAESHPFAALERLKPKK
jgi:uncharacterized metal-binding protein YceD (DUF177 family)